LLTILHIPSLKNNPDILTLIDNLQKHWEKLYFITPSSQSFSIELAYRLSRKQTLLEILKKLLEDKKDNDLDLKNVYFALLELGAIEEVEKNLDKENFPLFSLMIKCHKEGFQSLEMDRLFSSKLSDDHLKTLFYIFRAALDRNDHLFLEKFINKYKIPEEYALNFDCLKLWFYLKKKDLTSAKKNFDKYSLDLIKNEGSPLHPLYGIWLYLSEGAEKAMVHFSGILEATYPRTPSLLSHFLTEKLDKWLKKAFFFEKRELYRELTLFYDSKGDLNKQKYFSKLALKGI
jgi:eukaryotic-like serine/threonine-protein kinase